MLRWSTNRGDIPCNSYKIHGNTSYNYWDSIELMFEILTLYFLSRHLGLVAAGALFTSAFKFRQASAGAFTPQEQAPLVGDDAAPTPSAPIDPSVQADESNNERPVPENSLCTICLDAPKDSFFDPCGHRCTCYSCGMRSLSSTNFVFLFLA